MYPCNLFTFVNAPLRIDYWNDLSDFQLIIVFLFSFFYSFICRSAETGGLSAVLIPSYSAVTCSDVFVGGGCHDPLPSLSADKSNTIMHAPLPSLFTKVEDDTKLITRLRLGSLIAGQLQIRRYIYNAVSVRHVRWP